MSWLSICQNMENVVCVDFFSIGFHLSATVTALQPGIAVSSSSASTAKSDQKVALVFDRRHITSCSCSCSSGATWCAHIVALCLFRIHQVSRMASYSLSLLIHLVVCGSIVFGSSHHHANIIFLVLAITKCHFSNKNCITIIVNLSWLDNGIYCHV